MDNLQAIAAAKKYISELYADEQLTNIGLEEIEHVPSGLWVITIAFSRPWNTPRTRAQEMLETIGGISPLRRTYKVVTLDDDGNMLSMKNRPKMDAVE